MATTTDEKKEEAEVASAKVVTIEYEDLQGEQTDDTLLAAIERAFGKDGIGLIAVRNVPGFMEAKGTLLPMAHQLVHLPPDYLDTKLTDADSLYNAGWSHGKEKLGDGEPDYAKGSFYYNPCTDCPGTEQDRAQYPYSYPKNLWPDEKLPQLEPAAKTMGLLLKQVTVQLAGHLDSYIESKLNTKSTAAPYQPQSLTNALKDTEKVKCRLLYYFPKDQTTNGSNKNKKKIDSWIGWHNDSGFLTALAGEYYLDHDTGKLLDCYSSNSGDNQAGLYVADRRDNLQRVVIPSDCLAIQMGECTQILSGGAVCATPHMVRAAATPNVARISLAAFVDTPPTFPLVTPKGCSREMVCHDNSDDGTANNHTSQRRVPPLDQRWTSNGMTFGDFLTKTFQLYYDWTPPSAAKDPST